MLLLKLTHTMKKYLFFLLFVITISKVLGQNEEKFSIPVVVHVAYSGMPNENFPTEQEIISKLADLNKVFNGTASFLGDNRDIGIQFRLATLSTNCTSTNGIDGLDYLSNIQYKSNGVQYKTNIGISEVELKKATRWEISQYLNIWIVNKIDGANTGAYAWLPSEAGGKDGIVITINDFKNSNISSFVNAIGRFLNLYSLWELTGLSGYSVFCGDDEVADTDFVEEYTGQTRSGINPCSGLLYFRNTENNFMSHNLDRNLFTGGQKIRMRNALQLPNRKSLITSITDDISSCTFSNSNTPVFTHNGTPVNSFKTLGIGKGGYIYAGTANQGLYKFNGKVWSKLSILSNTSGSNNINDIKTDKNGGIWIAQYGHTTTQAITGGLNYLPDSTEIGHIQYSPVSGGLPTRNCRALFIDTSSIQVNPRVWTAHFSHLTAGTTTTGAVGLGVNSTSPNFSIITAGIDISTQSVNVQTIGGDENEIWAFASGNFGKSQILVYDTKTAIFKKAYDNSSDGFPALGNFLARAIYFDKYKYFDETAQEEKTIDRRWVGVSNGGVLIFQKPLNQVAEGTWTHVSTTTLPTIFPAGSFINTNSITSDDTGNIYFGTTQGLVVFTGGDMADSTNYQRFTNLEGLPSNNVLDVIYSKEFSKIIVATTEGIIFWNKSIIKKNLEKINITYLIENFNQSSYTVPREATVHHYFTIKKNIDEPVSGVYIAFKIGNTGDTLVTNPSNDKGLIDINFPVGGGNVTTSADDFIPAGLSNVIISFVAAIDKNLDFIDVRNNQFANNSFMISVIDKVEPIEEEFGIGLDLSVGGEIREGTKVKVGNIGVKMGYGSIGIGGTFSPSLTFTPDQTNPSIWKTKIASPLGIKLNTSAGPKFEGKTGRFGVEAGATIDLEGSFGTVEEYNYNLDITNNSHLFFLGANIFSTSVKLAPSGLMLSNFLYRLANFSGLANSEKYGFNIGLDGSLGGSATFGISKEFKKKPENPLEKEIGLGFGVAAKAGFNANLEFAAEITQSEGVNFSTTATADASANLGVEIGLDYKEKQGGKEDSTSLPLSLWEGSVQKKFIVVLNRHLASFNGELLDASVTFSNEQEKEIESNDYNITYNNKLGYNKSAIDKIGKIESNYVYNFFKNGVSLKKPFSLVSSATSGAVSSFSQIKQYQTSLFGKSKGTFGVNDFSVTNTRDITRINDYSIGFGLTLFAGVEFELEVKEWNKYSHNLKEYKYAKDFNKLLPVIDYPDIESNIQLPPQTPLAAVIDDMWEKVDNTAIAALNAAKGFVTQLSGILSSVALTFSNSQNGNVVRLGLDANPFIGNIKNAQANTTPSTFSFNIPGGNAAFNTGNELLFKYYYPENQLNAITTTDTFKLVTDVFFLNARNGATNLTTAPNGNYTVTTQFSTYELELAGLPITLTPKVLFQPIGSNTWEVIGNANQTINFNRLGVFAIGVALQNDFVPPTIAVVPPTSFVDGQNFQFALTDNLSGIDWSKTYFVCNGIVVPFQRVDTENTVNIPIASLHAIGSPLPETFAIQIRTIDLAFNKKSFFNTYPCSKSINFLSILGSESPTINKQQALETIEVNGLAQTPPPIELKAGKSILLKPGFEVLPQNGEYFKADIGSCNSSNIPAQPANFTISSAVVCKGTTSVVYTIPNEAGVTYNWSYSGTGATIVGTSNSITIDFASNATSGNLAVTATNSAGTSPARVLSISTNTPPAPPTTVAKYIGIGTSTSLSATGCSNYTWYNQATNGTLLFTGNNFVTPTLNVNTTFYVACSDSPCPETTRTPLVVSVGAVPTQPSPIVGGGVACQGRSGLTYLVPAVSGVTSYTWTYSGTGVTFVGGINNTRTITLDFSYSATSGVLSVTANNAYGSSIAQTMAISASPAPNAPTASGVTTASGNTATLTATGCSTYKWYSQATLGTSIFTGQNFTTSALNTTTTYYVACNNGTSCESPRVAVTVTVL